MATGKALQDLFRAVKFAWKSSLGKPPPTQTPCQQVKNSQSQAPSCHPCRALGCPWQLLRSALSAAGQGCSGRAATQTLTYGTSGQAGDEQELEESECHKCPGGSLHAARRSAAAARQANSSYWDRTSAGLRAISGFRPRLAPILTRGELPSRDFSGVQKHDVSPKLSDCCLNPFWTLAARPFAVGRLAQRSARRTDFPLGQKDTAKRGENAMQMLGLIHPSCRGWAEVRDSPEGGT